MDLGDPEVVNFTRKPSSILFASRSTRTLSSVFTPLSSLLPLASPPASVFLHLACLI